MDKPHGIIVFGPNGSGKTTIGRELARILDYRHMDIEEYHFAPTEIPYTIVRTREDCLNLMLADMEKHRSFVLTAVTGDFGETIPRYYELAVHLSAPVELRMKRIEYRAFQQHGDRVREGGDMYHQQNQFMGFAATRPLSKIDEWAETLTCPILHVDSTEDWRTNAARIAEYFAEKGRRLQTSLALLD